MVGLAVKQIRARSQARDVGDRIRVLTSSPLTTAQNNLGNAGRAEVEDGRKNAATGTGFTLVSRG